MKIWKTSSIYTEAEQIVNVQPTPEFDGIEFWFTELDGKEGDKLYIIKEELPEIIKMMQEMMDHVTKSTK